MDLIQELHTRTTDGIISVRYSCNNTAVWGIVPTNSVVVSCRKDYLRESSPVNEQYTCMIFANTH